MYSMSVDLQPPNSIFDASGYVLQPWLPPQRHRRHRKRHGTLILSTQRRRTGTPWRRLNSRYTSIFTLTCGKADIQGISPYGTNSVALLAPATLPPSNVWQQQQEGGYRISCGRTVYMCYTNRDVRHTRQYTTSANRRNRWNGQKRNWRSKSTTLMA
jgi:hypothetical protein